VVDAVRRDAPRLRLRRAFARLPTAFRRNLQNSTSIVDATAKLNGYVSRSAQAIDQALRRQKVGGELTLHHPRVQGARVGQTLEVKNSDATLHNIHSMSTKGNDFNVGQPLAGMVYKYPLKTEEVMLHVRCDMHSWMTGYVGVVSHPYFSVTDAAGAFTIANVPAGKQTVQVWHEQYGALTQTVDVKAGGTTTVEFAYTGNEKPSPSQTAFAVQELVVPVDTVAVQLLAPSRPD
jgi:hypothetical protein